MALLVLEHDIHNECVEVLLSDRKDPHPAVLHLKKMSVSVVLKGFLPVSQVSLQVLGIILCVSFYHSEETVMHCPADRQLLASL
jgi:hypothetical protein